MAKKPTEEVLGSFEVESVDVIKKGSGKRGPWKLYEIEFTNDEDDTVEARGFDKVKEGDTVEVFEETTYDEDGDPEYTNTKYRVPKKGKSSSKKSKKSDDDDEDEKPAKKKKAGNVSDAYGARILKLLAVVAAEVGVDEDEINAILEEK